MPLRCLIFSSNEETVQPIWQALTDLGIEGEYCRSAVDAVERVTTQLFQIVITDWEDQPEAAFLLKTARDLKAAHRPLTLAIVSDDARLPEALQAGANSVLLKPIRAEQVRDTMRTACELLRAKVQPSPKLAAPVALREKAETAAMAAAAGAVSMPAFVTQSPEKSFRAGEFLQSPSSAPGAQFDTESEVQKELAEAKVEEVEALTELEPTASAVEEAAPEPTGPREALTGWAALQARLAKPATQPVQNPSPKSELLSYGDTPSYGGPAVASAENGDPSKKEAQEESRPEAALFAYMSGKPEELPQPTEQPRSKRGRILLAGTLAAICVVLTAMHRTRQSLPMLYRRTVRVGRNWLNPPPAPLPQAVAQHDSFGLSGDEYKLPMAGNIPDATTDPSQIRVLPVIDPTAKPEKSADSNAGQAQATPVENSPAGQNLSGQSPSAQGQAGSQSQDAPTTEVRDARENVTEVPAAPSPSTTRAGANADATQTAAPSERPAPPVRQPEPPPAVSAATSVGIPSSLKSQIASMTPQSSGAKPVEAAMSSIEPVNLPEVMARELLAQPVDPEYPAAAKGSGQRGSVVLQVLIGRDGAVQDAKFLQGSLVFARAAIDAVKQWRFNPYSMNGRAVSVQTVITLSFKPPA